MISNYLFDFADWINPLEFSGKHWWSRALYVLFFIPWFLVATVVLCVAVFVMIGEALFSYIFKSPDEN